MGHGHRPVEIKTFRPEISSVDIMIAGVSSCLLPLGGGGDDECGVMEQISPVLSVRSCNTAVLSWRYLHPAQLSHHIRDCKANLAVLVTMEEMDPAIILSSHSYHHTSHSHSPVRKPFCPGLSHCHTATP